LIEDGDPELIATGFQFTEGPVWQADGSLIFSDIPASRLYRWTPEGGAQIWREPTGNANGNTSVISAGPGNDISTILGDVLSAPGNYTTNVNYILSGYRRTDLNLDGKTLAAGPNNDVNIALTSVFVHPGNSATAANFIVQQQLP